MSYTDTKTNKAGSVYDPADTQFVWAEDWNTFVLAVLTHATRHNNGGADEISVEGLSGKLADAQTPLSHTHAESDVTSLVTDLAGKAASTHTHAEADVTNLVSDLSGKAALAHKTRHENGGADEITVEGLSGLLADSQTPLTHNQAATTITSGELDGDRLPAMSTTKRGAVPATSTPAGKFLRDDGSFSTVGTMGGSTGDTDNAILRADGAGGSTLQNSLATVDDSGSINIPAAQTFKVGGSQHTHAQADITSIDHGLLTGLTDDDHVRYFDKDGSKALTGSDIKRSVDDQYTALFGGTTYLKGGYITARGINFEGYEPGGVGLYVTNSTGTSPLRVFHVDGNTNTPVADFNSRRVVNVADPTSAQDAATKNYVDTNNVCLDGSRALTGSTLKRKVDNSEIVITGGTGSPNKGAYVEINGADRASSDDSIVFTVPNAAKDGFVRVVTIKGVSNTPYLHLNSWQIKNVLDPTAAQDAATKNYVDTVISMTSEEFLPAYATASDTDFVPAVAGKKIKVHSIASTTYSASTITLTGTFGGASKTIFYNPGLAPGLSMTPDIVADTNTDIALTITGSSSYIEISYRYIDA